MIAREGSPFGMKAKEYMDPFVNPPDVIAREMEDRRRREEELEAGRKFPEEPQRDVLLEAFQRLARHPALLGG